MSRFFDADKGERPRPTQGIEYTFARKALHSTSVDKKAVAHIWEISGTQAFAEVRPHMPGLGVG